MRVNKVYALHSNPLLAMRYALPPTRPCHCEGQSPEAISVRMEIATLPLPLNLFQGQGFGSAHRNDGEQPFLKNSD